jgi:hypothetical protein
MAASISASVLASVHNIYLSFDRACRFLHLAQLKIGIWILWVHQHTNRCGSRNKFVQKPEAFGLQCRSEQAHAVTLPPGRLRLMTMPASMADAMSVLCVKTGSRKLIPITSALPARQARASMSWLLDLFHAQHTVRRAVRHIAGELVVLVAQDRAAGGMQAGDVGHHGRVGKDDVGRRAQRQNAFLAVEQR